MSFLQKFFGAVVWIGESFWAKLLGLCVVCAAACLSASVEIPEIRKELPAPLEHEIERYPFAALVGELLPVPAFVLAALIEKAKKLRDANQPQSEVLLSIIEVLGYTVGNKTGARHCEAARVLKCANASTLTNRQSTPELQIEELVKNVWQIFRTEATQGGMTDSTQLKVTLAEMDCGQHFIKFRQFLPNNLYPGSEENLKKASGFSFAAQNGSLVVIEDLNKELRSKSSRYARSKIEEHNKGCIILIPIDIQPLDGLPSVPLVLSVKCDLPKIFRNRFRHRYLFLTKPFVERIRLEFYNEKIKGASV